MLECFLNMTESLLEMLSKVLQHENNQMNIGKQFDNFALISNKILEAYIYICEIIHTQIHFYIVCIVSMYIYGIAM